MLFYEYFHGKSGGIGASHQAGWTGVAARIRSTLALLVAATVLVLSNGGAAAARVKATPCRDGRFVVRGEPLLAGGDTAVDAVVLLERTVAVESGCAATRARWSRGKRAARLVAVWRKACGNVRRARLKAKLTAGCTLLTGTFRREHTPLRRFTATRTACGDAIVDTAGGEGCDDGNTAACDGCAADCSHVDRCVDGLDCSAYVRPEHPPIAACPDVDPAAPGVLPACARGSGNLGRWTVDADGYPAYDFDVDQRCDSAAHAYSPRPRPLRDPIHLIGNGRGLMAMAHASGAVELYTQDRGHKWVNKVDLRADPENPDFPPQVGGGFGYLTIGNRVESTRFDDLPPGIATARQHRRFGVGYFETTTTTEDQITIRRRVLAPASDARALVVELTATNGGDTARDLGLVEVWDPNLHQIRVELLTSDLLVPGVTDWIERQRRALAAAFSHEVTWDATTGTAVVTSAAKSLPEGITSRLDPSEVDWFPDPLYLSILDEGVAPDRVWLTDGELWPDGTRTPPAAALAAGDGAPSRTLSVDGDGQRALLALRVPVHVEPGASVVRHFAFGVVPGGGAPDEAVRTLRVDPAAQVRDAAAAWRSRLVWAAFPGLADAAVVQRELAWSSYAAIANASYDEYRGRRVLGQGGAYRFIHGLDGAMGDLALFADAMLLVDPDLARDTLAYALATQQAGSEATPWRYPYATTGVGGYSDVLIYSQRSDAYWFLPAILGRYVALTRDAGFLSASVPYWPLSAGESGSVLDHVARGLDYAETALGYAARGLVAMGTNDYADGVLNLAGDETATPTGTSSTYNAGMIALGFPLLADVVEPLDAGLADRIRRIHGDQAAKLVSEAWTGAYFHRGFVDDGDPLAPHIFFQEPQTLGILAGLVCGREQASLLDLVAERLETPIGALSNVAVGEGGPIGGIDQPLVGGVWPVANAWLTAAYARHDPGAAWASFVRNTLATHAEEYPDLWYGIWTGPDSFNGPDKERPGEADAHLATALTDYPALNAHVHTGPLRALPELVGVEGTADAIRIMPRLPSETFHVRWPRLSVRSTPTSVEGTAIPDSGGTIDLEVGLPSGLTSGAVAVSVGGAPVASIVTDGAVRFTVVGPPGVATAWRVTAGD